MKKINASKLSLDRETLAALSPDVLGDVHGGNVIQNTVRISLRVCPTRRCGVSLVPVICAGGGNGGGGAEGGAQ